VKLFAKVEIISLEFRENIKKKRKCKIVDYEAVKQARKKSDKIYAKKIVIS